MTLAQQFPVICRHSENGADDGDGYVHRQAAVTKSTSWPGSNRSSNSSVVR